jgi:hypothetical protein
MPLHTVQHQDLDAGASLRESHDESGKWTEEEESADPEGHRRERSKAKTPRVSEAAGKEIATAPHQKRLRMQWELTDPVAGFDGPAFCSGPHTVATKWSGLCLEWIVLSDTGEPSRSGTHFHGIGRELTEAELQGMPAVIDEFLWRDGHGS